MNLKKDLEKLVKKHQPKIYGIILKIPNVGDEMYSLNFLFEMIILQLEE